MRKIEFEIDDTNEKKLKEIVGFLNRLLSDDFDNWIYGINAEGVRNDIANRKIELENLKGGLNFLNDILALD